MKVFNKTRVGISYDSNAKYPSSADGYNPDFNYPEYLLGNNEISSEKNDSYRLVRQALYEFGLDVEHFGSEKWNPLGEYIKQGNTVLVKPNWVMHKNEVVQGDEGMECLVTHPSVIRAVVDYINIALGKSGKIIVADAPMQECKLDKLFLWHGYKSLFTFWDKHQEYSNIEILDLRKYAVVFKNGVVIQKNYTENTNGGRIIDLEEKSLHNEFGVKNVKYKVSDYPLASTNFYHNDKNHKYEVNACVLCADVIISLPKPKCHRLAGLTGAMKNFVGIVYEKASLPHRKLGNPQIGGDSYKKKSYFKDIMQLLDEKKTELYENKKVITANIYSFGEKVSYVLGSIFTGDSIRVGSWYGNDTIWRTIADLNYILLYADKNGQIQLTPQRKILSFGDMIVCGQKNGPIKPIPKELGMIMVSDNSLLFDVVLCKIMGFKQNMIKCISCKKVANNMGFSDLNMIDNSRICINGKKGAIRNFKCYIKWKFIAHDMWKGYIEL